MSSFLDLDESWQKPKRVSRSRRRIIRQKEPILRQLCETSLGSCLRVIVNECHPNLEKTTSSVPSVILFNLW